MKEWELDFEWLRVQHQIKDLFGYDKLPDLNGILFLIGIRELGQLKDQFTKEEKQDLMHIAVCRLLSEEGYFEFKGIDEDGWPHWEPAKNIDVKGLKTQELLLKRKAIQYFSET